MYEFSVLLGNKWCIYTLIIERKNLYILTVDSIFLLYLHCHIIYLYIILIIN